MPVRKQKGGRKVKSVGTPAGPSVSFDWGQAAKTNSDAATEALTPTDPAGITTGDVRIVAAYVGDTSASIALPAGYTEIANTSPTGNVTVISSVTHDETDPTTVVTVTLPATQADDIIIFGYVQRNDAGAVAALTGTFSETLTVAVSQATAVPTTEYYWARATGNHTGETIIATLATADSMSGGATVLRGAVASGSPIDTNTSVTTTGSDDTGDLTGFNTTVVNALLMYSLGLRNNVTWSVAGPTVNAVAMTEEFDVDSAGGSNSALMLASYEQAATGATGDFDSTTNTSVTKSIVAFAVKPALSGGGVGGELMVAYKAYAADSAPEVTFSNLTNGDGCIVNVGYARAVGALDQVGTVSHNASAQNVGPVGGITPASANTGIIFIGGKAATYSSSDLLTDDVIWERGFGGTQAGGSAITVISSVTHDEANPTTVATVTLPTTQANDIVIFSYVQRTGGPATLGGTFAETLSVVAQTTLVPQTEIYWARATGNHSGETITATNASAEAMVGAVTILRGALATGSPIDTNTSTVQIGGGDGDLAGFSTTVNDALVMYAIASRNVGIWNAAGPTMNAVAMNEEFTKISNTAGNDASLMLASLPLNFSGATGAFDSTSTQSATKSALAFAVKPAAAAGISASLFVQQAVDAGTTTVTSQTLVVTGGVAAIGVGVIFNFLADASAPPPTGSYLLDVTLNGTGTGNVTAPGVNCPAGGEGGCDEVYPANEVVTLFATPTTGSLFAGWGGDASGTTNSVDVTMSAAKSVTATFNTPSVDPAGRGTLVKQDLMTSVTATIAKWQALNPNIPERLTRYATGGPQQLDAGPAYTNITVQAGDHGPNESSTVSRLMMGKNPGEDSDMTNTFCGMGYGTAYHIEMAFRLEAKTGWTDDSQLMQVHHDYSCSKSPPFALTESGNSRLTAITKPFGDGTNRIDFDLGVFPENVWHLFILRYLNLRHPDGYMELWHKQDGDPTWDKICSRTYGTVLPTVCGPGNQITCGPYSKVAHVTLPHGFDTGGWGIYNWAGP